MRNDGFETFAKLLKDRDNEEQKEMEIATIIGTKPIAIKRSSNGFMYSGDRLIIPQSLVEKEYKCEISKNPDKAGENVGTIEYINGSNIIKNISTGEDMLVLKLKYEFKIGDEVIIAPLGNSYIILDKVYRG